MLTRGSTGQSVTHGRCSYCPPGNSPRYVLGAACHESQTGLPGGGHGGQRLAVLHLASSQQQRELMVAVCLLCGAARDHQRLHCTSAALPFPRQLPHRTPSYGANQEKAVAEARQGLVELSAFSFVPVLEGLMRMIESLQEVRTGRQLWHTCTLATCMGRWPQAVEPCWPMVVVVLNVRRPWQALGRCRSMTSHF